MARNDIDFFKPPSGRNPSVASYALTAGVSLHTDGTIAWADGGTAD